MQRLHAFLRSQATLRGFVMAGLVAAILALATRLAFIPMYHTTTGFLPFDVQPGLTPFTIAVELGAFHTADARGIYLLFAIFDTFTALTTAWLVALLWIWLFDRAPTRLFTLLARGGIFLVPFYVVGLDIAAKVGFFQLVGGDRGDAYQRTVEICALLHKLEYGFADLRNYATVIFLIVVLWVLIAPRLKDNAREQL